MRIPRVCDECPPRRYKPIDSCESPELSETPEASTAACAVEATAAEGLPGASREADRVPIPFIERFLANFLQERNIRWLLVTGAAIVFGSSLMLVTREWEQWSSQVKYLTVLGYTAATFGMGRIGHRHLGLRQTGRVLQLLTVLLLPVTFLALRWFSPGTAAQGLQPLVEFLALSIPAVGLLWYAATQIFDDVLRERQTTFLVSYLMLSAAGALPVVDHAWAAGALSAALWCVMTAGVVKVNRHVFRLVEDHRQPRISGFLPIALLGTLYLTLAGFKTVHAVSPEWLGFGCVLLATTILLTARAVADVFRQRTGDLVRPLPWSVGLPLFAGLVLVAVGVCVSFIGFPATQAVVPTAALAAILLVLAAQDTRHSGFTWAALMCVSTAYQTSPAMFREIVLALRDAAAGSLQEQRLPLAFYGLTWLPLIVAVALGSATSRRRAQLHFSRPMQNFATILSTGLFTLSLTHLKAAFLVALVNSLLFTGLALLFRDRRYLIGTVAALIIAAGALVPFGNAMLLWAVPDRHAATCLAVVSLLLVVTPWPDRLYRRIPLPAEQNTGAEAGPGRFPGPERFPAPLFSTSGYLLAAVLAIVWGRSTLVCMGEAWTPAQALQPGILLMVFGLHTVRSCHYLSGLTTWLMSLLGLVSLLAGWKWSGSDLLTGISTGAAAVSLAGHGLLWRMRRQDGCPEHWLAIRERMGLDLSRRIICRSEPANRGSARRISEAFLVPLCDLLLLGLICLTVCCHLPILAWSNLMLCRMALPMATTVMVFWVCCRAWLTGNTVATATAAAILPLWCSAALLTVVPEVLSRQMLPVIWAVTAGVVGFVSGRNNLPRLQSARSVCNFWLTGIVLCSSLSCAPWSQAAGILALGSVAIADGRKLNDSQRTWLAIMANVQLLLLTAVIGGIRGWLLEILFDAHKTAALPLLLPMLGLSLLVTDRSWPRLDAEVRHTWSVALRAFLAIGTLLIFSYGSLPASLTLVAAVGMGLAAAAEMFEAIRRQREIHFWTGLMVVGIAVTFLVVQGVFEFGRGFSQFAVLGGSLLALALSDQARRRSRFLIVAFPLQTVGLSLPLVVAVTAIVRDLQGPAGSLRGLNLLALLSAAAVYFHYGLTRRRKEFVVAAGAILNLALMLLWRSLNLTDPQFFMVPVGLSVLALVEMLKSEIPAQFHDPLRYVGALTILVSPMSDILTGSWVHLMSLMVLSVAVIVMSIGLRLRVLVFTGTAFLLADLAGIVVRSTIDHPGLLWVCGLALGAAVIALAAVCERHRENVLAGIRTVTAKLAAWS